jgi:hypothetical protein
VALGFSDTSCFHRAFKRWHDETSAGHRKQVAPWPVRQITHTFGRGFLGASVAAVSRAVPCIFIRDFWQLHVVRINDGSASPEPKSAERTRHT